MTRSYHIPTVYKGRSSLLLAEINHMGVRLTPSNIGEIQRVGIVWLTLHTQPKGLELARLILSGSRFGVLAFPSEIEVTYKCFAYHRLAYNIAMATVSASSPTLRVAFASARFRIAVASCVVK